MAAVVGGTDYKAHARRVLALVFNREFSRQINFTGRPLSESLRVNPPDLTVIVRIR